MSMTRRDFESLGKVLKTEYDSLVETRKVMDRGVTDGGLLSYNYTQYESAAIALARVAHGMARVFAQNNPLFREWLFYEACGLKKFYVESRADRCGEDWTEVEGVNMAYLYLSDGHFGHAA